jgi:hypothetical protein
MSLATTSRRPEAHLDAERSEKAAAPAFGVVRRAIVEGVPVTRRGLADEAAYTLDMPAPEALRELDLVAQRLGIASLA